MDIIISTQEPAGNSEFAKREWAFADVEHFGHEIDWVTKKMYLLALNKGQIIGALELSIQAGVMHIEELIVAHDQKRHGFGKVLMEKAETIAKEEKVHKIYLETGHNWPARKFYESLGYFKTADLPRHLTGIDYIQYSKFLS